jgi:hypothetical protein
MLVSIWCFSDKGNIICEGGANDSEWRLMRREFVCQMSICRAGNDVKQQLHNNIEQCWGCSTALEDPNPVMERLSGKFPGMYNSKQVIIVVVY